VWLFLCVLTFVSGDDWRNGKLPLPGSRVARVEDTNGVTHVYLEEHSYRSRVLDRDGQWLMLCAPAGCASELVPLHVVDRSPGLDVEVSADVGGERFDGHGLDFDVVLTRVRIRGEGPRADEWRRRVELLRGHHHMLPPQK